MLRSMTGYGRGEAARGEVSVVVELRSVNNRFRDVQVRAPRSYLPLEPRIHNALKAPFSRGRIDAFVRRSLGDDPSVVRADIELAREYLAAIQSIARALPGVSQGEVPVGLLVGQPGVLNVSETEIDVITEWYVVETALGSAVSDLLSMREAEGRALYLDLQHHLGELRGVMMSVDAQIEGVNERLKEKIVGRVRKLLADRIEPHRLEQEAALLADKADVSEEVARLRSHAEQFSEALELDEPVGRRLDFLLQEMNREVNTIGSKAAEQPLTSLVVDMKAILERMREQAANVE
ncbi:MAG: YicC family protein [Deltaproteobacteria bacterium]|nr:YicC family protein [Deltaproteobacteria bacterium]